MIPSLPDQLRLYRRTYTIITLAPYRYFFSGIRSGFSFEIAEYTYGGD
jgi:hypothetical protein